MITVDRLFVLDPTLTPYKSPLQALYHNTLVRRFVTASAHRADVVVAVSEYTSNMFARTLRVNRPEVILNAVDTDFFNPEGRTGAPDSTRRMRLLYVGKLSRRKGADLLAPIMRELGPRYHLAYTGTSNQLSRYGNLSSNMSALGRLSQEEVRDQYRQADILLFPSRGEGLARTVMEALACGTPVVASDTSSLPEAIDHCVGMLSPVDDLTCFVEAIRTLSNSPTSWSSCSRVARQRAEQRFALPRLVDDFTRLLHQVVHSH